MTKNQVWYEPPEESKSNSDYGDLAKEKNPRRSSTYSRRSTVIRPKLVSILQSKLTVGPGANQTQSALVKSNESSLARKVERKSTVKSLSSTIQSETGTKNRSGGKKLEKGPKAPKISELDLRKSTLGFIFDEDLTKGDKVNTLTIE